MKKKKPSIAEALHMSLHLDGDYCRQSTPQCGQ